MHNFNDINVQLCARLNCIAYFCATMLCIILCYAYFSGNMTLINLHLVKDFTPKLFIFNHKLYYNLLIIMCSMCCESLCSIYFRKELWKKGPHTKIIPLHADTHFPDTSRMPTRYRRNPTFKFDLYFDLLLEYASYPYDYINVLYTFLFLVVAHIIIINFNCVLTLFVIYILYLLFCEDLEDYHAQEGFIVQSDPKPYRNKNKNKKLTRQEKYELEYSKKSKKRAEVHDVDGGDTPKFVTASDHMLLSKRDKARKFHMGNSYISTQLLNAVKSMDNDVSNLAGFIFNRIEPMEKNGQFSLDFKKCISESPSLSPIVKPWMLNMGCGDIIGMLQSCKIHELSKQPSHPYTLERSRLLNEASTNVFSTRATFAHAIAAIMYFAPAYTPVIFQNQDSSYPLPTSYCYFSLAQVSVDDTYGDQSLKIRRGEANFLHQLFLFSSSKISKSQIIGVFKSIHTKYSGNMSSVREAIRSRFPLFQDVFELEIRSCTILNRLVNRPIWFTNMLPREMFYIEHVDGDRALFKIVCSKVQSLQDQIIQYAEEYLKLKTLTSYELSQICKARVEVFKDIMRQPVTQAKFHAGFSKKDICNEIYRDNQNKFKVSALPTTVEQRIIRRKGKRRCKQRQMARRQKYDFIVESNPRQIFDTFSTFVCSPFALCFSTLSLIFTTIVGLTYTIYNTNRAVSSTSQIVNDTISNWNVGSLLQLDRRENPEYVIRLLEIKTVIHMIYEWQYGTRSQLMAWASNFLLTQSATYVTALTTICSLFYVQNPTTAEFEVQTDPKSVVDAYTQLSTFLSSLSIKLSPEEIRLANSEFAYLNNLKKDTQDKAQFACTVISVVCRVLFSFDPFDREFQEFSYQLLQCIQFVNKWDLVQPTTNVELQEVVDAYTRFNLLPRDPQMIHVPAYLKQLFTSKYNKLETMASEANNILVGDVRRVEPVVLLLTGAPGSGKTTAMNFIKQAIANLTDGKVDNYTMNIASDYFEGYRNQTFVTMDDVFITTDTNERSSEVKHIINMTNSTPFNLNMAFGEKGKKFFNSKYILMTTNALRPDTRLEAGLTDPEAFLRRCHIRANRDEPCTGNIINDTFVITHCQVAPQLTGMRLNAGQLARVMLKQRKVFEQNYNLGTDTLQDIYQLRDTRYDIPGDVTFNVETNTFMNMFQRCEQTLNNVIHTCTPESYIRLLFEVIDGACAWWDVSWIPFIVMLFLTLATATVCMKFFFPDLTFDVESHDERKKRRNPRSSRRKKEKTQRRIQLKRNARGKFKTEDMVEADQIQKSIAATVIHVVCRYITPDGPYITNCVGHHVKENIYMLPSHFYDDVCDYQVVDFLVYTKHGQFSLPFPDPETFVGPDSLDVTFVKLKLPNKPAEAYSYFLENDNDSIIENFVDGCVFALLGRDENGSYTKDVVKSKYCRPLEYDYGDSTYYVEHPWYYEGQTNRGDSGASLCYMSLTGRCYIVGMHAGRLANGKLGAAIPINQEMIDDVLGYFEVQSSTFPFVIEGKVSKPVSIPTRTRIRRSRLWGYHGPPKCIPAKLAPFMHDGQLIDPKTLALAKLHTVPTSPTEIPASTLDYLMNVYPPDPKYQDVLSIDMALQGDPTRGIPSIDATTSPGYPYCLQATKGKAPFIVTIDGKHQFGDEAVRNMILAMECNLRNGEQIEVLWPDMLKDETRPIEKVLKGKTRIFSTCPLHYLLLGRMYFQGIISYIQSLAPIKPISVGLNVHSRQWDILYNRMNKDPTWSVIAGDFENYDGLLPAFVGRVVCKFINNWYNDGPVNARVRELLMEHIFTSTRLHEQYIYKISDGNPSGNFMTSIYNSLAQVIMWYTVFVLDFNLDQTRFDLAVYGDDNLLVVDMPNLSVGDFAPHFKRRFGMTYTHWSKDQSISVVDTIDTVTYLGRRFVRHSGYTLAPLELDVIFESIYWKKSENKSLEVELTVQIVRSIAQELSHHSIEVFDRELSLLKKAITSAFVEDKIIMYIINDFNVIHSYYDYHTRHYSYSQTMEFQAPDIVTPVHISRYDLLEELKDVLDAVYPDPEVRMRGLRFAKRKPNLDSGYMGIPLESNTQMLNASYRTFNPESSTQRADVTEHGDMTTTTDNSHFTTRAANDLEDTQNVQLGSYQDAAPIISSAVDTGIIQSPYENVNMETFDLSDVLNREYPIGSFPWSTSNAQGFQLFNISFPQALLTQPFISDKIKNFYNFKAGIRVTFRMSSNMFNYGRVMIRYSPDPTNDAVGPYRTWSVAATSGYPHILLSASSSEVAVLDIPFISPQRAINLTSYVASAMGAIYATVLNPLTNVMGSVSNSDIFVTAQFIDAQLYLPFSPQSNKFRVESGKRKIVSKKSHVSREAIQKSEKGVISGTLEDTSIVAAGLSTIPLVAPYANLYNTLAAGAAAITEIIGLDKPATLARTEVGKINPYSDMANARGVDTSLKLSVDPENGISTMPVVGGISTDEMSIKYIAGTPTCTKIVQFSATSPLNSTQELFNTSIKLEEFMYARWLADLTTFYSGSYKIKLYITASNMHAARIVLHFNNGPSGWQQCYHRVVDIQGDTEVEMLLPYWNPRVAVDDPVNPFKLYATLLAYSQPQPSVVTPIYINVYAAMASDFCLYGPRDRIMSVDTAPTLSQVPNTIQTETTESAFQVESNPRLDFQQEFQPLHESMTGYKIDNLIAGEEIETYRDFVHRYMPVRALTAKTSVSVYEGTGNNGTNGFCGLELYGLIFRFYRGSIRFKLLQRENGFAMVSFNRPTMSSTFAGTSVSCSMNPIVEFETPYYDNALFLETGTNSSNTYYVGSKTYMFLMKAGGDDFSFHFLIPPPNYDWPGSASYGIDGMETFFTYVGP